MNRSNKILLSFVLPILCLLISVSNAGIIESNKIYNIGKYAYDSIPSNTNTSIFSELNSWDSAWFDGIKGYLTAETHEQYSTWWNDTFIPHMYSTYNKNSYILFSPKNQSSNYYSIYFYNSDEIDFAIDKTNGESYADAKLYTYITTGDSLINLRLYWSASGSTGKDGYNYTFTTNSFWQLADSSYAVNGSRYFLHEGASIKTVLNRMWDGTSYYYEYSESGGEDTPSLPSNAEIAQAVQAFYNSDYYKNNKDFKDFIVMYNYETQYFSFIGHNFGIDLGQVIVPPNYEYDGYSYNQDWWKFFLRNITSQVASNLWNRYYWLYSTNDFGENLTYTGKGRINDLLNLHWATSSIIVYSTTDYPVVKIETDENGVLTPVEGTILGDQYTYDENLDPTTNEYNPLENFVPTNPSQTILGDVDFDEINKTFDENKGILNIENASWLFTANNQFVTYFIGFLSLLIVFLIISRILGG